MGPHLERRASPNPPSLADPALAAARAATLSAAKGVYGRFATDLTGGTGDTSAAPVAKKTLLGG